MTQPGFIQVREEDNSMENANAYLGIHEHLELMSEEGAAQVFENILSTGLPSLYRNAHRLLGNFADAEDAVQDALLAAYTHLDQFKGQAQMSSWLTAILLNCARMQLRIRRRHIHVPLDQPIGEVETPSVSERLADHRLSPEEECKDSELSARLTYFHTQLSPTLRRTFQLRDIDGLSIQETARILGIPSGTVKARSARARQKLKDLMRGSLKPRSRSLRDRALGCGGSATSQRSGMWGRNEWTSPHSHP
jgi:RNA polymerase sigma-70 factor, ECF subfamily